VPILTVCVSIPMKENTSASAPSGARRVYSPSALVTVPIPGDPCTTTVTPGNGKPSDAEVTVPVTVRCCAYALPAKAKISAKVIIKRFLIKRKFKLKIIGTYLLNSIPKYIVVAHDKYKLFFLFISQKLQLF
jgi:hypothetical protein